MIYLYGLCEGGAAVDVAAVLTDLPGLQAPLEVVQIDRWTMVFSQQDDAEILPKRRLMLAHTRVLERMLSQGAVLPARFGLVAESLERAQTLIGARAPVIEQEFDRIRGCIELGIRIRFPREAALAATLAADQRLRRERDALADTGLKAHLAIASFGGKLAEEVDRRRGSAQAALLAALLPLARDHVLRAPEADTEVLRAEFLIDASHQTAFESAVQEVSASLTFVPGEEPAIQIVGPVPVYNFVRLSLTADPQETAA